MFNKIKSYLTVILSAVMIFGFLFWGIIQPDKTVSESERRYLASFPEVGIEQISSGKYMSDFESYTLDHFPLRDTFRGIKAYTALYAFGQRDNNDIFVHNGQIYKNDYPLNLESVEHATSVFANIYSKYLSDSNNVYLSVIPDKNYYLKDTENRLSVDYDKLISVTKSNMEFADYIDITDLLETDDYYRTDSHWRQERIVDVANLLSMGMKAGPVTESYKKLKTEKPFYGVYHGQSALKTEADDMYYLTNDIIENAECYYFEDNAYGSVYNMAALDGLDPYEMYLSGSKSLIAIENKNSKTDKELIIFRDSFASSLAPLLIENYSKITLVDIRYISSSALGQFIEFNNQDILFIYSTSVLNNSVTLK